MFFKIPKNTGEVRTHSNIRYTAFCRKNPRTKSGNYFSQTAPSQKFNWALTPPFTNYFLQTLVWTIFCTLYIMRPSSDQKFLTSCCSSVFLRNFILFVVKFFVMANCFSFFIQKDILSNITREFYNHRTWILALVAWLPDSFVPRHITLTNFNF